ncbi:MAG: hypothetical protein ACP5Q1_10875, partial [Anaerolineae bacterium]
MSNKEITPEENVERPEEFTPTESTPGPEMEMGKVPSVEGPQAPEIPAQLGTTWPAKDVTDTDRLMAALAYATQVIVPVVVPAVMLLAEESKKRPFQKFHAIQSLGFLAAAVIY